MQNSPALNFSTKPIVNELFVRQIQELPVEVKQKMLNGLLQDTFTRYAFGKPDNGDDLKALHDDLSLLKHLSEKEGLSVAQREKKLESGLHQLAHYRKPFLIKHFLKSNPDLLGVKDSHGLTLYSKLLKTGQFEFADDLLGLYPEQIRDSLTRDDYSTVAHSGEKELLNKLLVLKPVSQKRKTALLEDAGYGEQNTSQRELDAALISNRVFSHNSNSTRRISKLEQSWFQVALQEGGHPNSLTNGQTPLTSAAFQGNLPELRSLIHTGADLNKRDATGMSPLHAASLNRNNPGPLSEKQLKVIKTLIRAKADINTHDNEGRTPLLEAICKGDLKLVQLLLKAGADVQKRIQRSHDSDKSTYLQWAANRADRGPASRQIVELLRQAGAPESP